MDDPSPRRWLSTPGCPATVRTWTSRWPQLRALRDYADKNGYAVVREYVDEARLPEATFSEVLVWKFSRFTRKREHAVAYKSMLRRRGVTVVSITEHTDDTPTGTLTEGIIETVDEFYSEDLATDVRRGMREAASRGFWVSSRTPFGYKRVMVQDGAKERPRLQPDDVTAPVVRRIFDMAENGMGMLDIARAINDEEILSATGKLWSNNAVFGDLEKIEWLKLPERESAT